MRSVTGSLDGAFSSGDGASGSDASSTMVSVDESCHSGSVVPWYSGVACSQGESASEYMSRSESDRLGWRCTDAGERSGACIDQAPEICLAGRSHDPGTGGGGDKSGASLEAPVSVWTIRIQTCSDDARGGNRCCGLRARDTTRHAVRSMARRRRWHICSVAGACTRFLVPTRM